MLKDQILRTGLISTPENLEIDILLYAAQKNNTEEKIEISDYLSWLPFAGLFLILQDLLTGQKLRITPEFKI